MLGIRVGLTRGKWVSVLSVHIMYATEGRVR